MARLIWGITGGSQYLPEVVSEMETVAAQPDTRITTVASQAGLEIIRHFGLQKRLTAISNGDPYREVVTPKSHGASTYLALRLCAQEYMAMVIAPLTSNSLNKLRYGIADTPVLNAASWAMKGNVSLFVLPTHLSIGRLPSPMFVRLKEEVCKRCDDCPPALACPEEAITRKANFPSINLLKCTRCGKCAPACPYGAIASNEEIRLTRRMVDQYTIEALAEVKGISVLSDPKQVGQTLQRYTVKLPKIRLD